MTEEELRLISERLTQRLHANFERFTVMLAIIDQSDPTPQAIIANGTGSLLNTGPGQFLVTNEHVYRAFETGMTEKEAATARPIPRLPPVTRTTRPGPSVT